MLARPLAIRSGVLIATILVLVLVILSPFALRGIAQLPGMNWVRLSNVGQTYGGISALLAALALVGVVLSLLYQARDVNIAREQASRTFHNELLRMELEDPIYMEALGAPWGMQMATDYDSLRQFNFIHMWVSYWQSRYLLNELPETGLRTTAALELFNSKAGRDYWSANRATRMKISRGRGLQFARILDQEYNKALAKGDPEGVSLPRKSDIAAKRSSREMQLVKNGIALGVTAGVAMGFLMGRRKRL
jgi:Family of unknown function (DUF6082)